MASSLRNRKPREEAEKVVCADDAAATTKSRGRRHGGCCRRCCCYFFAALALFVLLGLAADGFQPVRTWGRINFGLMRFFRDLSRAKARRRRFGQKDALMPLLMGREEPLPLGDASAGLSLTIEELAEYDGRLLPDSTERAPLLLAVRGRIYDVSAGWPFYGPGKSYHKV